MGGRAFGGKSDATADHGGVMPFRPIDDQIAEDQVKMRCLADFVLDSDLCMDAEIGPLHLVGPNNDFKLTLSNAEHDPATPKSVLSGQITFEVPSFDNIRTVALTKITECLNSLTFVTSRKFTLVSLQRIVDWTPGINERRAQVYHEAPEWDMAEPKLDRELMDSAERVLAMSAGAEQQTALRWYRLGIQESILDQQFSYFWFALEIAAQYLKSTEKVPSKCPRCKEPLYCRKCGEHPTHRRYPGEAIQQTIHQVHPDHADEIFETLQIIRHTLMHGGRIASVIENLPCNEQQAVSKLATITWLAISAMFDSPDPRPEDTLTFGAVENIARRTIVVTADVTIRLPGDPDNPQIGAFPKTGLKIERLA